jgi:hypothetical protein
MKTVPNLVLLVVTALLFSHAEHSRCEVLLLHFDEGTGTTVRDSSPAGNDGTITSELMWTSPGYNGEGFCLAFPGQSGETRYVTIPHDDSLNAGSSLCLSAWVKQEVDPSGNSLHAVLTKGTSSQPYGLLLQDNQIYFSANYQTGGEYFVERSSPAVPFDEWTHISVVYDQQEVHFFVNGRLDTVVAHTDPIVNNSQPVYIGYDPPGFPEQFTGLIDEPTIGCNPLGPAKLHRGEVFLGNPDWRLLSLPLDSSTDSHLGGFPVPTPIPGAVTDSLATTADLVLYRLLLPEDIPLGNILRASKTVDGTMITF